MGGMGLVGGRTVLLLHWYGRRGRTRRGEAVPLGYSHVATSLRSKRKSSISSD